MQEELEKFSRNEVWDLVTRPEGTNVIGNKWVYKNKHDEKGVVTRNKARLVFQGYTQMKEWTLIKPLLMWLDLNQSDLC